MRDVQKAGIALMTTLALAACPDDPGGTGDGTDGPDTEGPTGEGPGSDTEMDGSGSSGETGETTGPVDCTIPEYEDDIVLQNGSATSLAGTVQQLAAAGGETIACGDGFFAHGSAVLEDPALAGPCTGVAAAGDSFAVVTTADGTIALIDLAGGGPTLADSVSEAATAFYDVAATETDAWVAAGEAGILHYAIDAGTLGVSDTVGGSADARGIAVDGDRIVVADGFVLGDIDDPSVGGARIRLVDAGGGQLDEVLTGPGIATRVYMDGSGRAVVLRPGNGLDVFSVGGNALTLDYSTFIGEALTDAAFDGDTMLVAGGSRMLRVDVGAAEATIVSAEDRPGRGDLTAPWFRAVAFAGGSFHAALGDEVIPVQLGNGDPAPEVQLSAHTMTLAAGQDEALFSFTNDGNAPLIVTGVEVDGPFTAEIAEDIVEPRPGCPGTYEVEPMGSMLFYGRGAGVDDHAISEVRILSNDPDEPTLTPVMEKNRPLPATGDPGRDFDILTAQGADLDFGALQGKVVLMKLYNPL